MIGYDLGFPALAEPCVAASCFVAQAASAAFDNPSVHDLTFELGQTSSAALDGPAVQDFALVGPPSFS